MRYGIEITADGSYIIDDKIHVDGTVDLSRLPALVEEYQRLNDTREVYTPVAMEKFLDLHGLLVCHFVHKNGPNEVEVGTTMSINGNRITKVSAHFLTLQKEAANNKEPFENNNETQPKINIVRMNGLLKAVG